MSEKEVNGGAPDTSTIYAGTVRGWQTRAGFNTSTGDSQKQQQWQSHGQESPHSGLELKVGLLPWEVRAFGEGETQDFP